VWVYNIKTENNTPTSPLIQWNLGASEAKANLSSVLDPNVGDTEGVYSPVKIESVLRLAKRQPLSKSRFIYLDYLHKAQKKNNKKKKRHWPWAEKFWRTKQGLTI